MKKQIALLLAVLIALSLCACGSASKADSYSAESAPAAPYSMPAEDSSAAYGNYGGFAVGAADEEDFKPEAASGDNETPDVNPDKIIYSSNAEIETTEFDKTTDRLTALVKEYGGWVQSSSVNGVNYYRQSRGYDSLRSANYTIRIPSEKFNTLMSSLSTLGNIPYSHVYSENVTAQYYDVSARLNACRTQETTLIAMMEKAETVSDVIIIEDRLTELRYQIERLQSTLNNWDRQVSYSTVDLSISEVQEYTPEPNEKIGYWQQMWIGFVDNLSDVGGFFKDLLLFLVTALPTLIVLAVIFLLLRPLFGKLLAGRRENRNEKREKKFLRKSKKGKEAPVSSEALPVQNTDKDKPAE